MFKLHVVVAGIVMFNIMELIIEIMPNYRTRGGSICEAVVGVLNGDEQPRQNFKNFGNASNLQKIKLYRDQRIMTRARLTMGSTRPYRGPNGVDQADPQAQTMKARPYSEHEYLAAGRCLLSLLGFSWKLNTPWAPVVATASMHGWMCDTSLMYP
jgi:hypothetical protein